MCCDGSCPNPCPIFQQLGPIAIATASIHPAPKNHDCTIHEWVDGQPPATSERPESRAAFIIGLQYSMGLFG